MQVLKFITVGGLAAILCCAQNTISTVAGTSNCCNSADGGQATSTWLTGVSGIALDKQGDIYIMDTATGRVRKVNSSGVITTVAGDGTLGYTGDGGPATKAELQPGSSFVGLAADDSGNLYISDGENCVIRKVDTSGTITTVAGNGTCGYLGDGQKATSAELEYPEGVAVDGSGNLYIADNGNNRVRKVTPDGIISTVAGNGSPGNAYSGDGVQANTTALTPADIALDGVGDLYISDTNRVRKVDANGIISTFAGPTDNTRGFSGDGGPATQATFKAPTGLAVDASGNVYIVDHSNGRVRKVDATGIITTIAGTTCDASTPLGDGGPATSACLLGLLDVKLDNAGNIYISQGGDGGLVRKVTIGAAALTATPTSLAFSATTGGTPPASKTMSVSSSGGPISFTVAVSTTSGGNWLSVTPSSGSTPATLTVSVNASGLAANEYSGAITITPAGGQAQSFAVTLDVTGASAPVIGAGAVYNALGYQTDLAPGVVFVVFGSGMGPASLQQATAPNYPTNFGGTSINLTPAAGGTPIDAKIVYTSAGQVAGFLPSSVTPGTYAMRVTYNGIQSAPQNVTVVARSIGIATANSAGSGTAQATIGNVNGGISLTRFTSGSVGFNGYTWTLTPAHPGDTLVLWGTGGGADSANDTGGSSGDQTAAGNFQVLVNGSAITPLYAGTSSGYPGLWQVNFTLPADVATGCFVPVQVSGGGVLSNTVTIPIAAAGQSACSDPQLSTADLSTLDAGGTVPIAAFDVIRETETSVNGTASQELASGAIPAYTASEYAAAFAGLKIDACYVHDRTATATAPNPATPSAYLDAGASIPISGPGLSATAALPGTTISTTPGPLYDLALTDGTIVPGGAYTLNAPGGKDVAGFTATVSFPASFSVDNWDSFTTINRSTPLTINWTSSGADTVDIVGSTSVVVGKDATNTNIIHTVSFDCEVPAAPGSYTVPTSVLSYLQPVSASQTDGTAILSVEGVASKPFSAHLVSGAAISFTAFSGSLEFARTLAVQ
jgi:trimeric autotransporter adhesin